MPIPGTVSCDLTPAANCEKISDTEIKFTLTADGGTSIKGTIGKFKNPFSAQAVSLTGLRYYQGC